MTTNVPENVKPFDLEHALHGAPIVTRGGRKARFVAFVEDADEGSQILVKIEGLPCVSALYKSGCPLMYRETPRDLFMAPLGFIEGKPVFTDDQFYVFDEYDGEWNKIVARKRDRDFNEKCVWQIPVPEPVKDVPSAYPKVEFRFSEKQAMMNKATEIIATLSSVPDTLINLTAEATIKKAVNEGLLTIPVDVKSPIVTERDLYVIEKTRKQIALRFTYAHGINIAAFVLNNIEAKDIKL